MTRVAKQSKPSRPNVFVALLRGVNVGGNNIISMRELKERFEGIGFTQVATYINSGNVIFTSKETDARKLEMKIERMLNKDFQLGSKVVVRSLAEMAQLVESLPSSWNDDSWRYNVMFLRHTIDSEKILDELIAKGDHEQISYRPGTVLWSAKATEINRTNMQKLSSRKIFQDMTVRNLNTTKKLHELMKKLAESEIE
jgi:uncharacterized protein (DUF1697 family)